jgi:hypothetical protein
VDTEIHKKMQHQAMMQQGYDDFGAQGDPNRAMPYGYGVPPPPPHFEMMLQQPTFMAPPTAGPPAPQLMSPTNTSYPEFAVKIRLHRPSSAYFLMSDA